MTVYPREATIFAAVCAIIFCVLGVVGNLVTIIALKRCPKLKQHPTTSFILFLCFSDFIFCAVNLPITATRYIQEEWTLGDALCKLFPVLFYGNVIVSVLNMVAITINRYVLISCHGMYSRLYTRTSINLQLLIILGAALLIMIPPLLGVWGSLGLDELTFSCTILEKNGASPKAVIFIVGFALPSLVIIISYSCIFCRVQESRKKVETHASSLSLKDKKKSKRREKDDRRLTKLMLTIFICFLLSFLPLMIVNVFDKDVKAPVVHVLASILAWMSSVINPFIYAASNRQYREAYGKLFNLMKSTVKSSESRNLSDGTNTMKSGQSTKSNQHYAQVSHKPSFELKENC